MARIKYKEAAGLEVKRGKFPIGKKPSKAELKRLYLKESRSVREVAEILGLKLSTIYKMSMSNTLPVVKVAGSLRFRRDELSKFIEENSRKPIKASA